MHLYREFIACAFAERFPKQNRTAQPSIEHLKRSGMVEQGAEWPKESLDVLHSEHQHVVTFKKAREIHPLKSFKNFKLEFLYLFVSIAFL